MVQLVMEIRMFHVEPSELVLPEDPDCSPWNKGR